MLNPRRALILIALTAAGLAGSTATASAGVGVGPGPAGDPPVQEPVPGPGDW